MEWVVSMLLPILNILLHTREEHRRFIRTPAQSLLEHSRADPIQVHRQIVLVESADLAQSGILGPRIRGHLEHLLLDAGESSCREPGFESRWIFERGPECGGCGADEAVVFFELAVG